MTPAFTSQSGANRPAFRACGGDVWWGSHPMTAEEVDAQALLMLREHDACLRIGDRASARVARKLFLELTDAAKAQERWKAAQSPNRVGVI